MKSLFTRRNALRVAGAWISLSALIGTLSGIAAQPAQAQTGAVFTSTNVSGPNSVIMFHRKQSGMLAPIGSYYTGGNGAGSGLGSQNAVQITKNGKWLLAVNAGSNDVSVFSVRPTGLKLMSRTPSGGTRPISLTVWKHLVYVLNAGTPNNITGFWLDGTTGSLTPIPGSTQPLSVDSAAPAQVQFDPFGSLLVVTEKGTKTIDVFPVNTAGVAAPAIFGDSVGVTPFGFDFDKSGRIFVSEAFGGGTNASAISSYFVSSFGILPATGSSPNFQTAACWVAVSKEGDYLWTTNTGSGSISAYDIAPNATIGLVNGSGIVATGLATPTDVAKDQSEKFLYALEAATGSVSAYRIRANGTLTLLGSFGSLGRGFAGLAAW